MAVVIGLLVNALVIEPARGANAVTLIILTIGVSLVLRGAAPLVFDKQFHKLPGFSGEEPVSVLGALVQPQAFWVVGGTAVIVLALQGVPRPHPVRQGGAGHRRRPHGGDARRHQHLR